MSESTTRAPEDTAALLIEPVLGDGGYLPTPPAFLEGLRERVAYLSELGITYLHLMPLFDLPEGDNDGGYAVRSYREVNPELGTMEELEVLATNASGAIDPFQLQVDAASAELIATLQTLRKTLEETHGLLSTDSGLGYELQETLTSLFAEKGLDPAATALVPKGEDPKEWLNKYGDFLAKAKREEPKVEEPKAEAAPEVPDEHAEERAAMEQLQGAGTGIPSTATADPIAKMKSFETEAELLAYIQSNGAT